MNLSSALRNLYISHTHVPPLTTCTMYNDCIYYNTDNTSQYTDHIAIYKIPHNIYKIHHNIQNTSQYTKYITSYVKYSQYIKIHHNTSDTGGV